MAISIKNKLAYGKHVKWIDVESDSLNENKVTEDALEEIYKLKSKYSAAEYTIEPLKVHMPAVLWAGIVCRRGKDGNKQYQYIVCIRLVSREVHANDDKPA